MEERIERFLAALGRDRGFSPNTVSAYRNDLTQFCHFLCEQHAVQSWAELSETILTNYVLYLRERGYANATVARKVAAVKSFCHYLVECGELRHDPAAELPSPKVDKFIPRAITPEQVEALLAQPARERTPEALRDKAMLETLYASGMRVSELTALDVDDLDLEAGQVRCGNKPERQRWVPLSPSAIAALDEYLQLGRPFLRQSPTEQALFLNHRGSRLTRQGFWLILKSYAEAAELGDITPHTLRHTFAAHALTRGRALREIQQVLGHVSISTTQVYQQVAEQVGRANGHALVSTVAACYDNNGSE
ncbi:tyrosine recombinase [Sphaerobacter sp.]|uniref:tyrosine recombinase n=1 Tax=Sphaerobacter sp. TaxID=2099654 RepID=UPI001E048AEF|nr:tyrosine recombinase [Sphaerobacter sp.]MBX5444297.1 tyrosine recombinase [Sphaerobacter sp.]